VDDCTPAGEPVRFREQVLDASFVPQQEDTLLVVVHERGAELLKRTAQSWKDVEPPSPPTPGSKLTSKEEAFLSRGHAANIAFIDLSSDGKLICTAFEDTTVRLWDRATLQRIGELLLHDGEVNCARFSPDNKRLVTSTANHVVRIWDVRTGAPLSDP